jgi:hypothetical protein
MGAAYELHDGKFVQELTAISVADALYVAMVACPVGKIRTFLQGMYYPSVAETRTITWFMVGGSGSAFPLTRPIQIALDAVSMIYPLVTEGLEIIQWPGQSIRIMRDVATAGSTMTCKLRFIETDLPYYSYVEPLKKIVQQVVRRSGPQIIGGRVGSSPPAGFVRGGTRGRDGGPESI